METILINGYTGKLGTAVYQHLSSHYHLIGCNQSNPIEQALKKHKPNMIIDITNAKVISQFLNLYLALKIPTIIGTSGIKPEIAHQIIQKTDFPLLIVPNFSLSFQRFAKACYQLASHSKSIQIIETHHQNKIDAPSGSSLFLAHALNINPSDIISHRVDYYIAKHEVILSHPHHTLSLSHEISSLAEFLPGVISAIHTLKQQKSNIVFFSND